MKGSVSFPGINSIISVQYSLCHGISPGTAICSIVPQAGYFPGEGSLFISDGESTIELPDCRVDQASFQRNASGLVWQLSILDRRWKWRFGALWGRYNVRKDDGTFLGKDTKQPSERTPQELATLCLEAMGESGFDVSEMPEDLRPEVEWDFDPPAECLAELCDECNCRVVLGWDNRVRICRAHQGATLPVGGDVLDMSGTDDPPELPHGIAIITAPSRYQLDFELEAVGLDFGDKVVPIDELSYCPWDTWEGHDPFPSFDCLRTLSTTDPATFTPEKIEQAIEYATSSLYRMYRIKLPLEIPGAIDSDGKAIVPETLDDVLPIETVQCETVEQDEDETTGDQAKSKPAMVYGIWFPNTTFANNAEEPIDVTKAEDYKYPRAFTIDGQRGIVRFSDPVYRNTNTIGTETGVLETPFSMAQAQLRLRTAAGARQPGTRAAMRFVCWIGDGLNNCQSVKHDELVVNFIPVYASDWHVEKVEDNSEEITEECQKMLDEIVEAFRTSGGASAAYAGVKKIEPDGAIQQVSVAVSPSTIQTTASRNTEIATLALSYEERRELEKRRKRNETFRALRAENEERRKKRSGKQ